MHRKFQNRDRTRRVFTHRLHASTLSLSPQTMLKASGAPDTQHPGVEVGVHCLIKALSSNKKSGEAEGLEGTGGSML